MYFDSFPTKIGTLVATATAQGLTRLAIDNGTRAIELDPDYQHQPQRFSELKQQMDEYLSGQRQQFDLALAPQGTEFQKQVWQALQEIPYGGTESYKQIAERVGNPNASRAVGMANNKNPLPIIVPCHRVIGANKKLTGYAFGLEVKQQLLDIELINRSFNQLTEYYGHYSWWDIADPFEIMLGAILVQNTNWQNVEKALDNLRPDLSPQRLAAMPVEELAEAIRPSGYYNQKAKKLKALIEWFEGYQYDIEIARNQALPKLRQSLLAISGIGGETADAILVYALHKPSFVIDAYARRLFERIGLTVPKQYEDFRLLIETAIPRSTEVYNHYHGLIVDHGQKHCSATPKCSGCPLADFCMSYQA